MNAQGTQQETSAWGAWVLSLRRVMVVRESQERRATGDKGAGTSHAPIEPCRPRFSTVPLSERSSINIAFRHPLIDGM